MAYKVGIVDDELIIREGIKKKIKLIEFEVIYETGDGYELIEDLVQERVKLDVLLIDIRMPGISGLEILERLRQLNIFMHSIILSGYSEFEYARKAITLGVDNYLLKPIDVEELNEALRRIEKKLKEEKNDAETLVLVDRVKNGKEIVEDITTWLKTHYDEHITLKETAEKFYINRSHLARIFKEIKGQTFNEFLTEIRIKKACELLKSDRYNLEDIAQMIGYEDKKYFNKVFFKLKGMSPTKYKEMGKYERA